MTKRERLYARYDRLTARMYAIDQRIGQLMSDRVTIEEQLAKVSQAIIEDTNK